MKNWKKDCRKLFATETKKSLLCKLQKPSSLAALFLLSLGLLSFQIFAAEEIDPILATLQHHAWTKVESAPCAKIHSKQFYELDLGAHTRELYVSADGAFYLSKGQPIEEEFVHCRPIPTPSFVEEL